MNTRIKELRSALSLTLEAFGNHLGVTRAAISNIERGERGVSEQLIINILKTNWNGKYVNEEWLRTGNGSMFAKLPEEDKFALAIAKLGNLPNTREVLTILGNDASTDFLNELEALLQLLKKGS